MKKILFILAASFLLAIPMVARKSKSVASATAPQPASTTQKGLFSVTKTGTDWYFSIPDSLIGREMLVTVRFTSTPANTEKYGGEMANEQTIYFEKSE